jgi:U3 small nucleolar RNA-associated protein 21
VSACGNFGLAGTAAGAIEMWNMQSGARRKTFALGPAPAARRKKGAAASARVITGLATDALNRIVVASTLDGTLNVGVFRHSAYSARG